jgi:aromatic-L-amino-acid decarboxylase
MANLVALVTARRARFPRGFREGVVYCSDQVHHSVTKAALVAGIADDRIHVVESDANERMRAADVRRAIGADRALGLEPFLVVANAGTTNTGAVDELDGLADLCAAERLWLHVDAAYGGFFRMTERGRRALRGIERADSVTLDPHKGLFLPYGTGALVVRDAEALRAAHSISASYMPAMQSERDLVDFCEISPELSREARGVRVWLPMKMHGAGAFRDALDEKLDLARLAARGLARGPEMELTHPPELALLAVRVRPPAPMDAERLEALQRRVLRGVNARQRVLLTSAIVKGKTVLRMCVLSFRTHEDRMRMALEDLRASLDEALATSTGAPAGDA